MTSRLPFDATRFAAMPLIAIMRRPQPSFVGPAVRALAEGGFTAAEITMCTSHASAQIRTAVDQAEGRLAVGAGTVTTLAQLDAAQEAGAAFIVTPAVVVDVISECRRRRLPVFPGAFSPTEIHQAHSLGATMVKLFPADHLGPDYIRAIKAPFAPVPVLATGGITPETLPAYVRAGADGFGIGSPLFPAEQIGNHNWPWLVQRAAQFCAAWRAANRSIWPA